MKPPPSLPIRTLAEFLGTAWLLIAIVGSGIMAQRLTEDPGLQLLQNALVTGLALAAIIAALRPISGAHVNPAVTLTAAAVGQLPWREAASYLPAQIAGGIAGTVLANLMFGLPAAEISTTVRDAPITWLGDLVATVGLLSLIFTLIATRSYNVLPCAVGAYVAGAYYFTSSTGVANPAVAIGRIFTDTFAGIAPQSALIFVLAQLAAAILVTLTHRLLATSNRAE
ncbi:MAG: aquaporin [Chloroflexota bacterium]|nr:aquaporin [Chloroflexota bacterium]MDE2896874.1 aquaporin [Chloroflexota bacterium]